MKRPLEGKTSAVASVCRKYGIRDVTLYKWRQKYEEIEVSEVRRLHQLEEENYKLKRLLADSMLDNNALKALLQNYSNAR